MDLPLLPRIVGGAIFALAMSAAFTRGDPAPSGVPAMAELLSNHDFSLAKKDPAFPDEWHRKPWMSWESEKSIHFLRLATTSPSRDISAWRDLALPPGFKALQVAIRYRTTGVKLTDGKDAGLRAGFVFLDAVKIKFAPAPEPLVLSGGAADWTVSTAKIAVPASATTLWFSVGMFQVQSGTLDLADVSVSSIPPSELSAKSSVAVAQTVDSSVPIRREGPHTIIGYGSPRIWFIHPYVDVLGHDFDMGISHLVQQAHDQGRAIAIGVAGSLDEVNLTDVKSTTYVFSYKNINYPLPEQAHRLVFLNTWLLPETAWPASRVGRKDVVLIGTRTLHNNGDGLSTNKDRWWKIQKADPDLTLTVLDGAGYFLPMSLWRAALLKVILEEPSAPA